MVKPVKTSDHLVKAQTTFGKSKYESTSKKSVIDLVINHLYKSLLI